ncbi:Uncharacterised protein [Neisseria meningitidis]|nr:Uncharacterised protein [Neisseria meningitidis]
MDVDTLFGERAEDFGGYTDVRTHTQTDCRDFAYGVVAINRNRADTVLAFRQDFQSLLVIAARYGKGKIGCAFAADILDNHIDFDVGIGNRA